MVRKAIYCFTEPTYHTSVWLYKSIAGIEHVASKKGMEVKMLEMPEDIAQYPGVRSAVLISARADWTRFMVDRLVSMKIRPVLVGGNLDDFQGSVSGTVVNRLALVEQMVNYLVRAGKRKLACVGNELSDLNDERRREAFFTACQKERLPADDKDAFSLTTTLDDCIARFLDHAQQYDAAICTNDYVAVRLIVMAAQRGILVPDQLYVIGSGNFLIGQTVSPTLTTSTLDYEQMGVHAANIYRYLQSTPDVENIKISVRCRLLIRGSTALFGVNEEEEPAPQAVFDPEEGSSRLSEMILLENCLSQCDPLDFCILRGILDGESSDAIAERAYVSVGTVNYRLKKLYEKSGRNTRKALIHWLAPYLNNREFFERFLV